MKKLYIFNLLALFILIATSCTNKQEDIQVFKITDNGFNNWKSLINITDSVTLQGGDNCVITYCDKCIAYNDYLYFWDHKNKSIFCFAKDGQYVRSIGKRGHSSSEYIEIKDMWINTIDSTLQVLDPKGVLTYKLPKGDFAGYKKLSSTDPSMYERIASINDKESLFFTGDDNSNSVILDNSKETIGLRTAKRFHFVTNTFYSYKDRCRVLSDYGDFCIDEFSNGELIPVYKIDLGEDALPDNVRPKTFEEFDKVDNDPKYYKCITEAYETDSWLYLQLVGPNMTYYYTFINKKNGKYICGKDLNIVLIGADKDSFHALIYPEYLSKESYVWDMLNNKNKECENNPPVFVKFQIDENNM